MYIHIVQKLTWKSTSLHKDSKDGFLLALGKPGKQKTKQFLSENLTITDFADENWSISNALGINIMSDFKSYAFGGYDDSSRSLFEKTLELDHSKHQSMYRAKPPIYPEW